jgi:N-dimethylarginine dimethylaminohydrolase
MGSAKHYGGQSMAAPLRRVMLCSPRVAGWSEPDHSRRWRELGYQHEPDFDRAAAEHDELRRELEDAGADVISLVDGEGLSLDAVYPHDASLMTDYGAISMNMGKSSRRGEPKEHTRLYQDQEIPILGEIRPPGTAEAGDIVWLDPSTVLVGRGYRTNAEGIEELRRLLTPKGVEVIEAPLPYGQGPSVCLHLMSILSVLDERTVLVDLPWLAVETVELLRQRDFTEIEIDPSERDTMACNVVALGDRKLLAIEENAKTNLRLSENGFQVRTFHGTELCQNGGGGPTCLTRPILRR